VRKYGVEEANRRLALTRAKQSVSGLGDNNGRWGKNRHTQQEITEQRQKLIDNPRSINNTCRGKNLEEIYGEIKAATIRDKQSAASAGSRNPMYGKPASRKAGIGWKGCYNGVFFRSLLELAFMLKFAEFSPKTAEIAQYRVRYTLDGVERTYCPDFVTNDGTVYEVKPFALIHTAENAAKFAAARAKFGKFLVVTEKDLSLITKDQLIELVKSGGVVPSERTVKKISEYCSRH
jgi:hypothetical protein